MGFLAWHLSWVMEAVGMERGYYPGDFEGLQGKKVGEKDEFNLCRKEYRKHSVLKYGGRDKSFGNFTSLVLVNVNLSGVASCDEYAYENPIRTLGDYCKRSHEGDWNTIELPIGTNVVPLRSDTICLPARSITTWEDLPTHFLAQFFPPGRTVKLRNDILMFQQHHEESLSKAWTLNPVTRRTIDQSAGGKLHDRNAKESWALLEDLALYENESWNDLRDFAKLVKAIAFPKDVPRLVSNFIASQDARLFTFEADFKQQQSEMTNKIDTVLKAITNQIARALPGDKVKNPKLSTSLVLSTRSYPNMKPQCSNHIQGSINAITIYSEKQSDSYDEKVKENEEEEKDSLKNIHVNPSTLPDLSVAFIIKKSSNSIHSLNCSDWFLNQLTPRSFAQRGTMEKSCLLS
uniref:Retrotransposon gag domain-containing protein n=1 Tax=Tanacetum cinerariifolium TaxID=118510 RepID=A0A6L2L4Y1_TANCI|nr:hypothetical protein [Tanacetum cinerariifolium]